MSEFIIPSLQIARQITEAEDFIHKNKKGSRSNEYTVMMELTDEFLRKTAPTPKPYIPSFHEKQLYKIYAKNI